MTDRSRVKASTRDHRAALEILKKTDFESGVAVERQVATHVRTLIRQKKLPPESRLPPIRLLAELWDTNYFTVQAALRRVVGEGLLIQSPKLGTFVAGAARTFQRACLYHDHDLSSKSQENFFSQLNITLYRLLAERGIQTTTHFDHRQRSEIHTAPPEVRDMVREHRIDAIIATGIRPENSEWLTKLGIPFAAHSLDRKHGGITLDFEHFAHGVIEAASKAGKRRLGVIVRQTVRKEDAGFLEVIEREAPKAGIEILFPRSTEEAVHRPSLEEAGFQLCEELLTLKNPPDALMVFPDVYTRGVVSSLLKRSIRVPEDVLVLSHRNTEAAFFTPIPVTWFDVRIEDFARGLLKQIDTQVAGKKPHQAVIRFHTDPTDSPISLSVSEPSKKKKTTRRSPRRTKATA